MKNINNYSSRSKNILTGTRWESLEKAVQFFKTIRFEEVFYFVDRIGNKGFFCSRIKSNREGVESIKISVFIEE